MSASACHRARETCERCGGLLRHGPAVDDDDGYFGERAAATYDEGPEVFGPGAADATADVLTELAGGGALELGIGTRRIAPAAGGPQRCGPRHRLVTGDGGPPARQARRRTRSA